MQSVSLTCLCNILYFNKHFCLQKQIQAAVDAVGHIYKADLLLKLCICGSECAYSKSFQ